MPPAAPWPARDAEHLLVTAAQMANLEGQLFASGLPVEALMEKAALAISRQLLADGAAGEAPWIAAGQGVLVLVGPGHNGGDGLVIARELHLAGIPVRIWSPFERHKPLTAAHLRHALWLGIPQMESAPEPDDAGIWIDALFGIGQSRAPGERLENLLEARQFSRPRSLWAVDGPTGLCADSGRLLGQGGATAEHTWSIGLLKRGFIQDAALARVGQLQRIDLGLPPALLSALPAPTPLALRAGDAKTAPWPRADPAAAKYGRGRLLLVAGSRRFRGAAHLALSGASASGCGSLRAALPQELVDQLWMVHPEVVLAAELGAQASGGLDLTPLAALDFSRLDAILLGPGLGGLDLGGPNPEGQDLDGLESTEAAPGTESSCERAAEHARRSGADAAAAFSGERSRPVEDPLDRRKDLGSRDVPEPSPEPGAFAAAGETEQAPEGLGASRDSESETWRRLQAFSGLLVLDADGLNRLAHRCLVVEGAARLKGGRPGGAAGEGAAGWLRLRQGPTWITPHGAEFARLFPALQDLEPLEAALEAARSSGATVLLKGARSVVAAADGRRWQVLQATPQAARAGLGDVLAGYAAGRGAVALAAQRSPRGEADNNRLDDASLLAAVVLAHAQAGLRCLERRGPGGVSPQAVAVALQQT